MKNYKKLAVKYLLMNKKRSITTVIGVVVTVMILYTLLNLGVCALLIKREKIREEQDYEIVFFTENQSQIEQIMADSKVKSASIGTYYDYDYNEPVTYDNALYVNTINPYRMLKIQAELEQKYGVMSDLNAELASTYIQSIDGSLIIALILILLLVTFTFAIFGVGIVRNSIQLSTLEQIKDYGNMRCIGASRGQLRTIIYTEGAILELTGCGIGVIVGFLVSCVIGSILKWHVGFHLIAVVPILVVFLFDLYFAMDENCKVVTHMTPVSAIRGEFRIRKEKIKVRKSGIFAKIFGVEGDYAYKNIMRNPGRFLKTVWAIGIAVAAFIAVAGGVNSIQYYVNQIEDIFKYYQISYASMLEPFQTKEEEMEYLPPVEILENISELEEVTEAKKVYSAFVLTTSHEDRYEMFTDEYSEYLNVNHLLEIIDNWEGSGWFKNSFLINQASMECYGYDKTDYARYEDELVDGSLDISENGILLVNGGMVEIYDEEMDTLETLLPGMKDMTYTKCKVGDTIDIVDMKKLRTMLQEEWSRLDRELNAKLEVLPKLTQEELESGEETAGDKLRSEYNDMKWNFYWESYNQLIEQGDYKSYVIEGILKDDACKMGSGGPRIIVPMEQYCEITGTDESMICGMQYHFEGFSSERFWEATTLEGVDEQDYGDTYYVDFRSMIEDAAKVVLGIGFAIIFVILMTALNIINTTASNLQLRRKELAQLRVIGVSKTHLMKMVMLEGIISSIVANVIGVVIGVLISKFVFEMIFGILFGLEYHLSVGAVIIGLLVSTFILCGAVFMGLKDLKQDIACDLALGGD